MTPSTIIGRRAPPVPVRILTVQSTIVVIPTKDWGKASDVSLAVYLSFVRQSPAFRADGFSSWVSIGCRIFPCSVFVSDSISCGQCIVIPDCVTTTVFSYPAMNTCVLIRWAPTGLASVIVCTMALISPAGSSAVGDEVVGGGGRPRLPRQGY